MYEESTHPSLELLIPHFSSTFTCNIKGALAERLSLHRRHDTISTSRHCCSGSLSSRCSLLFFFLFDLVALLFSESYNLLDFHNLVVAYCYSLQRAVNRLDIGVATDTASEEDSTESKARGANKRWVAPAVAGCRQNAAIGFVESAPQTAAEALRFQPVHAIVGGAVCSGHTAGFDSKRLSSARQNEKIKGRSGASGITLNWSAVIARGSFRRALRFLFFVRQSSHVAFPVDPEDEHTGGGATDMRPENCSWGLESLQLAQNWVHTALEICFCAGAESSFVLALDSIDSRVNEGWRRILRARQSSIEVMKHAGLSCHACSPRRMTLWTLTCQ